MFLIKVVEGFRKSDMSIKFNPIGRPENNLFRQITNAKASSLPKKKAAPRCRALPFELAVFAT
jgi:hypothetical protein